MKNSIVPIKRIGLQFLLLLFLYFISRCLFTVINLHHFEGITFPVFADICYHALRYDTSAILSINALYIFLVLLPFKFACTPRWEKLTRILFISTNMFALIFELSDWAYFPFIMKRASADILNMVSKNGDVWHLLPGFLVRYWYIPVSMVLMCWLLIKLNKLICNKTPLQNSETNSVWLASIRLVFVAAISVIAIRGGLQYVPINTRNAVEVVDNKYVPILLNTPFSIINTYTNSKLEDPAYFPEGELPQYFNTHKLYAQHPFNSKNVVVIIVEGLSKVYTKIGGATSYTPFIDSLMDVSLVCTHAYANAMQSNEGIPAVIAGMPDMMDEPITTSAYSTNKLTAFPNLLKYKGYTSAFYHGGTNGTMSFDLFSIMAGYDKYYGRKEYNNDEDYDGTWGIFDEPYLQYVAGNLNTTKQPFFASVFTLSSHEPFKIPAQYENNIPADSFIAHRALRYTDISLRKFFETVSKQAWYKNALFIITADHSSPMVDKEEFADKLKYFSIPIIYFAPGDSSLKGHFDDFTQQIDILPSTLDYLGYDKPFFAFGNSIFSDNEKRYAFTQLNGEASFMMNNSLLRCANFINPLGLFKYPEDKILGQNILEKNKALLNQNLAYLKAFIQIYNSSVIHNKLWVEPENKKQ